MAGFAVVLDNQNSLMECFSKGVYSTKLSTPNGYWSPHHEGTCSDYASMHPGDNIYFFIDRKFYGVGELTPIRNDCKALNYPSANTPNTPDYTSIRNTLLLDTGQESVNCRWVCFFKPAPYFFKEGIDIDELLTSNPVKFKMVRAFWKLSFIKVDDEENQAFKDAILKLNTQTLENPTEASIFPSTFTQHHEIIARRLTDLHKFNVADLLEQASQGTALKHEKALELGILHQLSNKNLFPQTINIFGKWDYLSHQVIASPFKPIDYMDKMDIFGYAYIENFKPTKSRFLIMELKRDVVKEVDIEQLLKYVDWVREEYTFGDYSMIEAFLVGNEFTSEVKHFAKKMGNRKFTIGKRPAKSKEWDSLKLVKYKYISSSRTIAFQNITLNE